MDAYEATRIVFSKIQTLDPENASRIMGLLLIQDHGEKEMIRLAFGPESAIHSVICKARKELLGISPITPTLSRQNSANSSRFNGCGGGFSLPSPLSIPAPGFQTPDGINNFSDMNALMSPFYGSDSIDEFLPENGEFWGENGLSHRRSCSVSDICDDSLSGFGWKPCLYYARGYCKNGTSCKFLHGGPIDNMVGSPSKVEMMEQCEELFRSKSLNLNQQQRMMNFLLQNQHNGTQRAAAALMMDEEMQKFGRSRFERNHFPMNGMVDMNPVSRQIYLTFPADSTFTEEDVSNYFSIFGPVQDVRIPYQQKRMFGFVTFVYADTVKMILAKGNPHFVCDARVLVKPYKEKGKVPDKYRKQQQCNSPTGLDARDPCDVPIGPRMFYNNQEMLLRRKLEEEALELQNRRLMSLQLLDVKKHHHHRALSVGGVPIGSPIQSPSFFNQSPFFHSDRSSSESPPENCSSPADFFYSQQTVNVAADDKEPAVINETGKEKPSDEDNNLLESLEHNLPDSPFASPTKGINEHFSDFSNFPGEVAEKKTTTNNMITSTLDVAPFSSCYFQMPRFSAGHGAIGL